MESRECSFLGRRRDVPVAFCSETVATPYWAREMLEPWGQPEQTLSFIALVISISLMFMFSGHPSTHLALPHSHPRKLHIYCGELHFGIHTAILCWLPCLGFIFFGGCG